METKTTVRFSGIISKPYKNREAQEDSILDAALQQSVCHKIEKFSSAWNN